jgi:hypothetical protein
MEKIKRIRSSALKTVKGKLRYKNRLFTGIAYVVQGGYVTSVKKVNKGIITGDYRNSLLRTSLSAVLVTEDCPEIEGIDEHYDSGAFPLKLRGAYFTGVLVEFEGDWVYTETLFEKGWERTSVQWYADGAVEEYDDSFATGGGSFSFYDDSKPRGFHIIRAKDVWLGVTFTRDGKIDYIATRGDFFNTTDKKVRSLPFDYITSMAAFDAHTAAEELKVKGTGFGDLFFQSLMSKEFFKEVVTLHLFDTAISPKQLRTLKTLSSLRTVDIFDYSGLVGKTMYNLKKARPDIRIECAIRWRS